RLQVQPNRPLVALDRLRLDRWGNRGEPAIEECAHRHLAAVGREHTLVGARELLPDPPLRLGLPGEGPAEAPAIRQDLPLELAAPPRGDRALAVLSLAHSDPPLKTRPVRFTQPIPRTILSARARAGRVGRPRRGAPRRRRRGPPIDDREADGGR